MFPICLICYILFILFIFIFKEKGKEGEKEGERHQCEKETSIGCLSDAPQPVIEPTTPECALTGNQTGYLLGCGMTPTKMSHTDQG